MKLKAQAGILLKSLQAVLPCTESSRVKPILSCVRIEANDGIVTLEATDIEKAAKNSCIADIDKNGIACVTAAKLAEMLGSCSADETVTLSLSGDSLAVSTKSAKYKLPSLPGDDFPTMPTMEDADMVDVDGLTDALRSVAPAVSKEGTIKGYAAGGIYIERKDGSFVAVATDTKLMLFSRLKNDGPDAKAIIPAKIATVVAGFTGATSVAISKSEARFASGNTILSTKLLEGRYPPWQKIIPKKAERVWTFNRESFLASVRRASITVDADVGRVTLELDKDAYLITAKESEIGSGESRGDCDIVEGDGKLTLDLDPSYLAECLKSLKCETVRFEATDALNPVVIRENEDRFGLIMPLG